MKLTESERAICRAIGDGAVTLRSLRGDMPQTTTHNIIDALKEKGVVTQPFGVVHGGCRASNYHAVGSDGTVYRKHKIWEDD